ncbi:MAG TPA: aminotransferase class IV [Candidatus Paceibacterota bacterium]
MDFKYFSRNGKILPIEDATIPLSNIEYQYGFGVYESIRIANGTPLFLNEHLERLENSAKIIGLEHSFGTIIYDSTRELTKTLGDGTYNLKFLLIGGATPLLYIIPLNPHFPDKKLYRDGVHLITYACERPFPHAKSLNMLQSYFAYKKAKEAGAYDALLVNTKGCVTEGTRTNFFYIRGKSLVSAPESQILLGVTRAAVLTVARGRGFTLDERDMTLNDIGSVDGAFITSTSSKILPVRSIDDTKIKAKPSALVELMAAYEAHLARIVATD